MMEETGKSYLVAWACILKFSGSGQVSVLERIQYTQFFRAQAGSCSEAYTESSKSPGSRAKSVYSNFLDPGRLLLWGVYSKLKEPGPRTKSVYSNFPGPGRLLFWGVYSMFKEPGPRAESVYSNFPGPDRLLFWGVYRKLKESGPRTKSVYSNFQSSSRLPVEDVYLYTQKTGPSQIEYTGQTTNSPQAGSSVVAYKKARHKKLLILAFDEFTWTQLLPCY